MVFKFKFAPVEPNRVVTEFELANFKVETPLGVGRDGASYRALHQPSGRHYELRILPHLSQARCDFLQTRFVRLELLFRDRAQGSAGLLRPVFHQFDADMGFIVMPDPKTPRLSASLTRLPDESRRFVWATALAEALLAAHRIGLTHGRLDPSTVVIDSGGVYLDLSGTRTGFEASPESTQASAYWAPEGGSFPAADVYGLGRLLLRILTGGPSTLLANPASTEVLGLLPLLKDATNQKPDERPALWQIVDTLNGGASATVHIGVAPVTRFDERPEVAHDTDLLATVSSEHDREAESPENGQPQPTGPPPDLGRFRLYEQLGAGAMGEVYRAEDRTTGNVVALKILRSDLVRRPAVLRRFHREARILSLLNSPYIARIIEVNRDRGFQFLVVEYIKGQPLSVVMDERERLAETEALQLVRDVARALVEAHTRGVVHRDVKPANIMVLDVVNGQPSNRPLVKLLDFGIARASEQDTTQELTRTGAIMGTPFYMSPEQCKDSSQVGPASDVYSLGATLFHLLAGRPPFEGDDTFSLMLKHVRDEAPPIIKLVPNISPRCAALVSKTLEKSPLSRFADGRELLDAIDEILTGRAQQIALHPNLPVHDPSRLMTFRFEWDLDSSVEQLWPFVSDTDRLNRAVGLPPVSYSSRTESGSGHYQAAQKILNLKVSWHESPFEWVEGQRYSVLRRFEKGPIVWYTNEVEFEARHDGGTHLAFVVRLLPRNLLGKVLSKFQIGRSLKRQLDEAYRRIDALLSAEPGGSIPLVQYEATKPMTVRANQRLNDLLDTIRGNGVDARTAARLGEFLRSGAAQDVAHFRPLALATRLGVPRSQMLRACLHMAHKGGLVLLWDVVCPACRVPTEMLESLRDLSDDVRCDGCGVDFEVDFGESVELVFRAHPSLRQTELRTYCIGSPQKTPHVLAQVQLAPGERFALPLRLGAGSYRVRLQDLGWEQPFRVQTEDGRSRLDFEVEMDGLSCDLDRTETPVLLTGHQLITMTNSRPQATGCRIESCAPRTDAVTATQAANIELFRRLFPADLVLPGDVVEVPAVTLMSVSLTDVDALLSTHGETGSLRIVRAWRAKIRDVLEGRGGALFRSEGLQLLAAFSSIPEALNTAALLRSVVRELPGAQAGAHAIAVHAGAAVMASFEGRLDYFGVTVNRILQLPKRSDGLIVLSRAVAESPQAADVLHSIGGALTMIPIAQDEQFALAWAAKSLL